MLAVPLGVGFDPLLRLADFRLRRDAALCELDRELLAVAAERTQHVAQAH